MNLLLDTHTLIWFFEGSDELGKNAIQNIENEKNTCFVSIVSIWEIAIKLSIKKMEMKIDFDKLNSLIWENSFELLPIKFEHSKELINLPFHHKDPFDRMIISQAIVEKMPIISKDDNFKNYEIKQIW